MSTRKFLLLLILVLSNSRSYALNQIDSYALFNDPTVSSDRYIIRDHVVGLINNAPPGSWIRAGFYSFTDNTVRYALRNAAARGVVVRLVFDQYGEHENVTGCKWSSTASLKCNNYNDFTWLESEFTRLNNQVINGCPGVGCTQNKIHRCGKGVPGQACISYSSTSIQHEKYMMFSKTYHPETDSLMKYTVVVSSANMTTSAASKQWNNSFVSFGDSSWYDSWKRHFSEQFNENKSHDYYDPKNGSGYIKSSVNYYKAYFSPNGSGQGDIAVYRIDDEISKYEPGCKLYVNQAYFLNARISVAKELDKVKQLGCDVRVGVNHHDSSLLKSLKAYGIPYKIFNKTDSSGHKTVTHNKYFIYKGNYDGKSNKKRVWLGSHNFTFGANYNNDEVIVKVGTGKIYDQYETHFLKMWNLY